MQEGGCRLSSQAWKHLHGPYHTLELTQDREATERGACMSVACSGSLVSVAFLGSPVTPDGSRAADQEAMVSLLDGQLG